MDQQTFLREERNVQTSVREPISGVIYPDETRLKTYLDSGEMTLGTMAEAFKQAARANPSRVVLDGPEGRLTFAQLDEQSDRLALAFHKLGLQPNDRAIFQLPNGVEIFICLLACFKAQVIPLCTLQAHRQAEIGYLGNHSKARLHLISTAEDNFDFGAFAQEMRETVPSLQHLVTVKGNVPVGLASAHSISALIAAQDTVEAEEFVTSRDRDPLQVALFQLSGGSTGIPKIIPRFDYEYLYQLRQVAKFNGYRPDDVAMMPTPVIHNANMGCVSLPLILMGAKFLVASKITPKLFFRMLIKHRPTLMGVVGPLLDRFHQLGISKGFRPTPMGLIGGYALSRLRGVISMNSAAQAESTLKVTGLHVFGMTEGLLMFTRGSDPDEVRAKCVGQPISRFDEVRLVTPGTEEDVPEGDAGELITRGPYTIRGFYDAEELNQESFTSDDFYRTGDLLKAHRVDGQIFYSYEGRIKDVIDRGGEKINAQEVERVLTMHPRIVAAAMVAMPDRLLGEKACAFLTVEDPAKDLEIGDVTQFLEERGLAKYKWPERLQVLEELPVTKIGKPDKLKMRSMIAESRGAEAG